jgi:anti-sigma factor RsiW
MSEHDRFRQLLVLRLAGDLDPDDAISLDAHLACCIACRDEAASLVALAPPPLDSTDDDGAGGFTTWRASVLQRTVVPHRRRRALQRAAIAAAIFLVGMGSGVWVALGASGRANASSDVAHVEAPPGRPSPLSRDATPPTSIPSGLLALAARTRAR